MHPESQKLNLINVLPVQCVIIHKGIVFGVYARKGKLTLSYPFMHSPEPCTHQYFNKILVTILYRPYRASLRALVILEPLLGTTWIFGILQFNQASAIFFSYLFVILNTTQV